MFVCMCVCRCSAEKTSASPPTVFTSFLYGLLVSCCLVLLFKSEVDAMEENVGILSFVIFFLCLWQLCLGSHYFLISVFPILLSELCKFVRDSHVSCR